MDPYPFDVARDAMRSTGPAGHVTSLPYVVAVGRLA
jgi:hypothetical protein